MSVNITALTFSFKESFNIPDLDFFLQLHKFLLAYIGSPYEKGRNTRNAFVCLVQMWAAAA